MGTPPKSLFCPPGTSAEISGFDSRKAEAKALVARARKMGEMMFDTWHFWVILGHFCCTTEMKILRHYELALLYMYTYMTYMYLKH